MNNIKIKLITIVTLSMVYSSCVAKARLPSNVDKKSHWALAASYYHPVKQQTSNTPLITADGTKIIPHKLKNKSQKLCALSWDLFNLGFKMGETIWIEELNSFYTICDKMNKRFTRKIDILQHPANEPMRFEKLTIRKVNRQETKISKHKQKK